GCAEGAVMLSFERKRLKNISEYIENAMALREGEAMVCFSEKRDIVIKVVRSGGKLYANIIDGKPSFSKISNVEKFFKKLHGWIVRHKIHTCIIYSDV
ncbi:MAG: hypothetical protein N3E36_07475, partial [Sulfolobales archaeon]|nr:hypothetical protein [Sulfolobales archaeon]